VGYPLLEVADGRRNRPPCPRHHSSLSYAWIRTEEMEARVLDDAPGIGFCDPPIYAIDRPIEMNSSWSLGLD
jgi:hypothetical protein